MKKVPVGKYADLSITLIDIPPNMLLHLQRKFSFPMRRSMSDS